VRPEHNEIAAASKSGPRKIVFADRSGKPIHLPTGEKADDTEEEPGTCTQRNRRGMGLKHHRKDSQNNVGIVPVAAGAGDNLQRLLARGQKPKEGRATWDWRMSP